MATHLVAYFMGGGGGSGTTTPTTPTTRTTGLPTSSNGASSFHLFWQGAEIADEYSATIEVLTTPTEPRTVFWALQASFVNLTPTPVTVGVAHTGIQWIPAYPNSRAVNWGGYLAATGGELTGTTSSLPSAANNPNTRDFNWVAGRKYRYRIYRQAANTWRASITDLTTNTTTVIRDLTCNATHVAAPAVWTESFTDCGTNTFRVRWSDLSGVYNGTVVRPTSVYVNYQTVGDGGCTNTNSSTDAFGLLQQVNTTRVTPQGATLTIPATTAAEFTTADNLVLKPNGSTFHGAGINAAFNLIEGPFVFQGFQGGTGPCVGAFDTPASRAQGCVYQGGGINGTIPVWDPPSGGLVNLPDRYYAINGVLTPTAASRGATAPADHWHQRIVRVTMVAAGAGNNPTPAQIAAVAIPAINEGLATGAVIVPEFHDLTGDNPVPTVAYNAPISSIPAGDFRNVVEAWDAVAAAFKTDGSGGTTPTAQGQCWLFDLNEPYGNVADSDGTPPAAYFNHATWWIKRARIHHGAENVIVVALSEWCQDLRGLARGKYDAWWTSLKNDPSGDLTRNIVMGYHNYGARTGAGGSGASSYTYATMDADLNTVLRTGSPAGYRFPIFVGEYGRPKDGVSGNAGPSAWNVNGFEYMMTNKHGQPLALKYPEIMPCMWHANGESAFWSSIYTPTIGTGINNNDGLSQPFWVVQSGGDTRLTEQGAAHWAISRSLWDLG